MQTKSQNNIFLSVIIKIFVYKNIRMCSMVDMNYIVCGAVLYNGTLIEAASAKGLRPSILKNTITLTVLHIFLKL